MPRRLQWFAVATTFAVSVLVLQPVWAKSPAPAPRPPAPKPPAVDRRPTFRVAIERKGKIEWGLHRNFASGISVPSGKGGRSQRVVRAVDVSDLDPKGRRASDIVGPPVADEKRAPSIFGLWSKKFDDPQLRFQNGRASVVDESVLTDLLMVSGRTAERLDLDGVEIGRVKSKEYDPVNLVRLLVSSGIVNANLHIRAHVTGWHGSSEHGHWFRLHSNDPYWTNSANVARYDFGIHIAPDGVIRLINAKHVGRLLVQPKSDGDLDETS